jgi:hypothetical protein
MTRIQSVDAIYVLSNQEFKLLDGSASVPSFLYCCLLLLSPKCFMEPFVSVRSLF